MEQFILLLACHFIGDIALQSRWLADGKKNSLEINFYHVAVYISVFILFGIGLSNLSLIILFTTHFVIDFVKSHFNNILKHVWQDQLLHILVLIFIFFITK